MLTDREVAASALMTGAFSHLLAPAATLIADGLEVLGGDECALHLASILADLRPDSIDLESVNGEAGLALRRAGRVVGVAVLRSFDARVDHVWLVTDPAKLRSWN